MILNTNKNFLPVFLISLCLVFLILLFSSSGFLGLLENAFFQVSFPLGNLLTHAVYQQAPKTDELSKLKKENENLQEQLVQLKTLQEDNQALRDQFQTSNPISHSLLQARVVGMPEVVPNVTFPESFVIDKGSRDNIKKDMPVVVKNNLVGIISEVSLNFSKVNLITSSKIRFPARDISTNAQGVLHGAGNGQMFIDNILLSDSLNKSDNIVTLGSQNLTGFGLPPDLIIGKILSVDKNPSSLFQKAEIAPLVSLDHLTNVFVLIQ